MDSSKPRRFVLRSTSAVSLNERFSQVLVDQLTQSRSVSASSIVLPSSSPVVLVVKKEPSPLPDLQDGVRVWLAGASSGVKQQRRRRSVWTRLGWRQVSHRLRASKLHGFWSFRNKYKWRSRFSSTYRRRSNLRLAQYRLVANTQNLAAEQNPSLHLQTDAASAFKGQGQRIHDVLTRKQLDAQLDEYMSLSKTRLDQQLDDYMSMSRQRLDAELDEYMLMAGQAELHWD